jgi:threonine dehydratase
MTLTTIDDLRAAEARIRGKVHRTGQGTSQFLSRTSGARVSTKLELFQKTGSFKVRGVINALAQLTPDERSRGVVSLSAGNHAQALAWGSAQLGIAATIVMPAIALPSKVEATRGYGGTVVQTTDDLLATASAFVERDGMTLIHPFDDPRVIAGQGTVGLEILEDVPDVDVVLVGCGGGGLLSGVGAAVRALRPSARVIGIEPEGSAVISLSLGKGSPQRLKVNQTIADGLAAPFTGANAFAHVQAFADAVITVSEAQILDGMRALMERCKLFVEPSAGAAVAPLLAPHPLIPAGARVVPIICGGNIDLTKVSALFATRAPST